MKNLRVVHFHAKSKREIHNFICEIDSNIDEIYENKSSPRGENDSFSIWSIDKKERVGFITNSHNFNNDRLPVFTLIIDSNYSDSQLANKVAKHFNDLFWSLKKENNYA